MTVETVDVDAALDRAISRSGLFDSHARAGRIRYSGDFVTPMLTAEFVVDREALAPVLASSLIGMALGALGVGPI